LALSGSSSVSTPTKRSCRPYRAHARCRAGISCWQGTHHDAHRFTKTGEPPRRAGSTVRPGAQAPKRETGQPGITARPGTASPGVRGAGSEPTALPVLVREVGMTHDVTVAAAATSNATSNGPLRNPLTPLAPRTALYDVS